LSIRRHERRAQQGGNDEEFLEVYHFHKVLLACFAGYALRLHSIRIVERLPEQKAFATADFPETRPVSERTKLSSQ
jgi:hypothetical protein